MTQHPFDPAELDRPDPSLTEVAGQLERYASETGPAPADLAGRVLERVEREPAPRTIGGAFLGWLGGRRLGGALAATAVVALAVAGAVAFGELIGWVRQPDVGASPSPTITPTPATPSPSPTPSPTVSPSPSASDDAQPESPEPTETDDDERETPEPTETEDGDGGGNSGPGGGNSGSGSGNSGSGSDNSGSGSDNSGPGGGDDD